jgi:methylase of polypeptide subunit release factors
LVYTNTTQRSQAAHVGVTAFDQTNLNTVLDGIEVAFKDFEKTELHKRISKESKQVKKPIFYAGLASVNGKDAVMKYLLDHRFY